MSLLLLLGTTPSGAMSGTAGLTFGGSGTLTGSGALAGAAAITLGQSGALTGTGALSGTAALTLGQSGTLTGLGALAGSAQITFAATGTLADAGGGTPATEPYPKPAGRGSRRRRYEVEIDGQVFPVESADHAHALLDRARALAITQAPVVAQAVVAQRIRSKVPDGRPIRVPNPQMWTEDAELVPMLARARVDIAKIYRDAAVAAEIAFRLQSQMIEEDDDDVLMFL